VRSYPTLRARQASTVEGCSVLCTSQGFLVILTYTNHYDKGPIVYTVLIRVVYNYVQYTRVG